MSDKSIIIYKPDGFWGVAYKSKGGDTEMEVNVDLDECGIDDGGYATYKETGKVDMSIEVHNYLKFTRYWPWWKKAIKQIFSL